VATDTTSSVGELLRQKIAAHTPSNSARIDRMRGLCFDMVAMMPPEKVDDVYIMLCSIMDQTRSHIRDS